ncbi:MAG: hypothetical protein KGR46_12470 [Verrucomicrobia bacterium]|nr:hypothetical protein [Verrucomicrobiota bacterium]
MATGLGGGGAGFLEALAHPERNGTRSEAQSTDLQRIGNELAEVLVGGIGRPEKSNSVDFMLNISIGTGKT